jgi:hypothetical protein
MTTNNYSGVTRIMLVPVARRLGAASIVVKFSKQNPKMGI